VIVAVTLDLLWCEPRLLCAFSMEAAEPRRFADDMAVHRFEQVFARRSGRKVQLGVERIEFEDVMVDRPRASAWTKLSRRLSVAQSDAWAVSCSVRQIARA
jgi:hypothetical protein